MNILERLFNVRCILDLTNELFTYGNLIALLGLVPDILTSQNRE
jgi:hypothetical protein